MYLKSIETLVYSGGTTEVTASFCTFDEMAKDYEREELVIIISKCNNTYQIIVYNEAYLDNEPLKFHIDSDILEQPKNLSDLDWQLLKITNSKVEPYQWQIFKMLKDLIDDKESQEYITDKIKEVLNKYEI
jgi:hypothetical protein